MAAKRIVHIITSLGAGGAEQMLFSLLSRMDRGCFDPQVISLTENGVMGEKIQKLGVPVRCLGMRPERPSLVKLLRLTGWLRQARPDVIQTWMYHADLAGGLAARLAGVPHVVWGIRHADLSPQHNKKSTLMVAKACAELSRWLPARIVVCSRRAVKAHVQYGYDGRKMEYIPNGFDLSKFQADSLAHDQLRAELGLAIDTPLIGMAARFHPLKDHQNFVRAAAELHSRMPAVHFLLCGDGINWQNETLAGWVRSAGLESHVHLLGVRRDMPYIFSGLDVGTLSSVGEAFPNVVGEMMACELPCVVTDVGDAAEIVGATGRVVPPAKPVALASAWEELLHMDATERAAVGQSARLRVEEEYELSQITGRYESLYLSLIN